jgi:hypothetical protein
MSWDSIYDVTEYDEIDDLRLRPDGKGYEVIKRCLGHPDEGRLMGETFFCDGSCRRG